jgi:hypothetical protein
MKLQKMPDLEVYYIAKGSVRGECGHKHKTVEAAERCREKDVKSVLVNNPSTYPTRAYSDRRVIAVEYGEERQLTEEEDGKIIQMHVVFQ